MNLDQNFNDKNCPDDQIIIPLSNSAPSTPSAAVHTPFEDINQNNQEDDQASKKRKISERIAAQTNPTPEQKQKQISKQQQNESSRAVLKKK